MCGCTLYDSPTCGHSWISMSQPCGYLADLLNCPYRQTYQTLVAPPYTCPMCNCGFADQETIEMVQGPWGCNQLIRNQVGGHHTIPGHWGRWEGPALTSNALSGAMIPMNRLNQGFTYDHRLTGPYGPPGMVAQAPMIMNEPMMAGPAMITDSPMIWDDDYVDRYDRYDRYYDGRHRRRRHKSRYRHTYTETNCTVM